MERHGGAGAVLSATIRTVAETGSTNADMLVLARDGASEELWLRAERQSAGRGRQGRAWESPAGNLYACTLVRLRPSDPAAATLGFVAAVAVEQVVRAWLPDPSRLALKWPNDLLHDGAKLSGILLERRGDVVVVGIGVNLAHHPSALDRPATSLAALGATSDPADFATILAESFAHWLARWRSEGFGAIRARWLERAHPAGTALQVRLPAATAIDGLFDGLDAEGALMLRLADGTVRAIHAADVFLI